MTAELSTSGDDFSVNGGKITDLAAGVDPTDAANVSQIAGGSGIPASIFDAKGDLIVASAADTAARLAVGANNTVPTAASGETTGVKWQQVGEAMIALTDETTLDATTARHGFLKKLNNSSASFMNGQGNWATPAGTAPGVAADTIWDAAGDLAVGTGADTATRLAIGTSGKVLRSNGTTAAWDVGYLGGLELVFKYTVAGSVKASIDTGVDTPAAGSSDWANGDVLEVYIYGRTNEAVASSIVNVTVNNDTGSNYDRQSLSGSNTTAASANSLAQTKWQVNVDGTSHQANGFGVVTIEIPNYAGTTGLKTGKGTQNLPDSTAGNNLVHAMALQYRSASAITRLAMVCNTGASSFAIGTQLLIYKRRST